ncbi:glycine zipper 2TM domain-containing protein [Pseudoduganella buxea]|uniref:Glycine zipper 2TM domain-containing protein n=1 Tax=Pseudoduganella buxea TaxID=1949069 RepID=A0A6I3SWI1_9BURK|nr:glycine zipper 2TM domain-containing protein [Pseudoduganella buxea]MTV52057.1 glycine zipper 2TM domain-containing protein [Pseudoduganella buxea]GGB92384.1 hypothetical protein GCM10011572_12970 [Pseudoduganella buxea]
MKLQAHLLLAAMVVGAVPAVQAADFEDFGRVVRVTPQVERYNRPREECRTEYVQVQQQPQRSAGGSIIGGVAGALLGSNIGSGSGRTAATAAGAIAGAIAGDRIGNQNVPAPGVQEQAVRQCRMVDSWESRTNGYEVVYDYRGRNYTSIMSYDPGERVRLRVSIEPMTN